MAQMMAQMKSLMPMGMGPGGGNVRYKRVMVVKDANGTTTTSTSTSNGAPPAGGPPGPPMPPMPGDRHVTMFTMNGAPGMERARHAMTAGEILMHLAGGPHEMGGPMMLRAESFGRGPMQWRHPHPMMPLTPGAPPLAPVTPAPQPTP